MRYFLILICLCVALSATAQGNSHGRILIRALDIENGVSRFYLAQNGTLQEIQVSRRSIAPRWFGWSPAGSHFAFLAPAREGINDELWLVSADGTYEDTPLLHLGLKVVVAAWNPVFDAIAFGTSSEKGDNGIYLLNPNTGYLVYLAEESMSSTSVFDWSHDGYWLAYSNTNNELKIINIDTRETILLSNQITPAQLPTGGWTGDDQYYIFADQRFENFYATPRINPSLRTYPIKNPYQLWMLDSGFLSWSDNTINRVNLSSGKSEIYGTPLINGYAGLLGENTFIYNDVFSENGKNFLRCFRQPLDGSAPTPVQFGSQTWTHTRCEVLGGGQYLAFMGSTDPQSLEALPETAPFSLFILPADFSRIIPITTNYTGAALAFSSIHNQILIQEGRDLVLYTLRGERQVLGNLDELGLHGQFIEYQFATSP